MLRRRLSPLAVYLILAGGSSLFFSLVFTVDMIYYVTVVGMSPLQLVLVGTTLEATIFLFEIPTGLVADLKSRRLSVVVGYTLTGVAFLIEGSFPLFGTVVLAQVLWGLGYTFTSGATQAWIADEIGEERVGDAFLRAAQAGRIGGLAAIPLSIAVGSIDVRLPILTGGALMLGLALFLTAAMTEEGFRPTPRAERTTWAMMGQTVVDARALIGRQPVLLALLGISLFYGLYSEGFDRLWTAHLLETFPAPFGGAVGPVVWIGGLRALQALTGLAAVELVRRRLDVGRSAALARALMAITGAIVVSLALFGLAPALWMAAAAFLVVSTLRAVGGPLHETWYNRRIDNPQVRATLFSVTGQVDALGQIGGGPPVGAIGNASVRAALVVSAALLAPVIPLYGVAMRREEEG
ncbi:MAG: MFS transporter [Anaerolineae bacterium]|jgi:DHA3 family tetracycline resistance protein-like MFS transporter